ncbi:MAG: hypothetical protein ACYCZ0_04565 [Minisyncoccota bacterium]
MNTPTENTGRLEQLVTFARESPFSDFYRNKWRGEKAFERLPHSSRADFLAVPLSHRRYKKEKGMVKIVGTGEQAFLSEWSFSDIGREPYAPHSMRPFVYLTDPYEAVEKSLWCYENGMMPLVGEKDSDMAIFAAGRYQIDSLIVDEQSLAKFAPFFSTLRTPLASISVIGSAFSPNTLMSFERYAQSIRLVLALPETGAFAEAPLFRVPKFTPLPRCHVEHDSEIVLTKIARYPTPIIRYKTGIRTTPAEDGRGFSLAA